MLAAQLLSVPCIARKGSAHWLMLGDNRALPACMHTYSMETRAVTEWREQSMDGCLDNQRATVHQPWRTAVSPDYACNKRQRAVQLWDNDHVGP